jgi:hypothetical protein
MKQTVDIDTQLASMEADEKLNNHDLPRLTSQQRVYVAARVGGLNIVQSSKEAGCGRATGGKWEADQAVQQHMDHYMTEMEQFSLPRVRFGLEDAHGMYMKAYHMSATATEMVKATDSLVKLHKLGDTQEKELPKTVTARQLADLPVAELLRLAGLKVDGLAPEMLEGEFIEVAGS